MAASIRCIRGQSDVLIEPFYNICCISATKYCKYCTSKFQHEELTLLIMHFNERYHPQCYVKTDNFKLYHVPYTTKHLHKYHLLLLNQKIYINQILFPHLVPNRFRFQIKLPNINLNKIQKSNLIKLCQQLDVCGYIKRNESSPQFLECVAKSQIRNHLNDNQCKWKNHCLVFGYCKQHIVQFKINVPQYLINIIHEYCPVFTE